LVVDLSFDLVVDLSTNLDVDLVVGLSTNLDVDLVGGLAVVENNTVLESMALPIAGLLSLEPAHKIEESIVSLRKATQKVGIAIAEPFIQMAFLALPVIPSLKITDKGLVDVTKFQFVELEVK
jgi:adenine deaminase